MNQRQKELEEIVQVSSQIKDMTQVMKKDVETQGEQLNNVESTTDVVKEEVTKAEINIVEAEKDEQSTKKTLFIISGVIVILVIFIVVMFLII